MALARLDPRRGDPLAQRDGSSTRLTAGMQITLLVDGEERVLPVQRVAEGVVWILNRELGALQPGETVDLQIGVRGDARYSAKAQVAIAMRDFVGLRLDHRWDRNQGREFARVNTFGHRVGIGVEEEEPFEALPLIDLSAGGARVAEEKAFCEGDRVVCRFRLGTTDFELCARVVRIAPPNAGERRFVSLEFQDVREAERADLVSWVNQEQVRRRIELRERSRHTHGSRRS